MIHLAIYSHQFGVRPLTCSKQLFKLISNLYSPRAVADQVYNDPEKHQYLRERCVDHVVSEIFSPSVKTCSLHFRTARAQFVRVKRGEQLMEHIKSKLRYSIWALSPAIYIPDEYFKQFLFSKKHVNSTIHLKLFNGLIINQY